jgi:hypothetical protein
VIVESRWLFQLAVTKIFSPGLAQPQRLAESFCCNTIPEEMIAGKRNWENETKEKMPVNKRIHSFFINVLIDGNKYTEYPQYSLPGMKILLL